MSFLTRTQPILRQSVTISRQAPRLFSTTLVQKKTATETAKDALKSVDRTVSDTIVKGIDKGSKYIDEFELVYRILTRYSRS